MALLQSTALTAVGRWLHCLPEPDPTAFLVDFEIEGTIGGVPRQPMGTFTLKVSPNWAPIGVERMRLVRAWISQPGRFLCL